MTHGRIWGGTVLLVLTHHVYALLLKKPKAVKNKTKFNVIPEMSTTGIFLTTSRGQMTTRKRKTWSIIACSAQPMGPTYDRIPKTLLLHPVNVFECRSQKMFTITFTIITNAQLRYLTYDVVTCPVVGDCYGRDLERANFLEQPIPLFTHGLSFKLRCWLPVCYATWRKKE